MAAFVLLPPGELAGLSALVSAGQTPIWDVWPLFLEEMTYLRRNPLTLESTAQAIACLVRHGRILTIEQATSDCIKTYLRTQYHDRKWKPWTYNTHRARLSSFFKFLWEEGLIQSNPMDRIRAMGLAHVHRPTLTEKKCRRILNYLMVQEKESLVGHRNLVFIHLLCMTGCRAGEALKLKLSDLDFGKRSLCIPANKGGKPRHLHISPALQDHLCRYLAYRHRIGRIDEWLLISASRKGRWTYNGVRKMLKDLSQVMGFDIHCHAFRRYAATQLAEQNLPVDQISQFLGHTNTRTTRLYINACTPVLLRPCTDGLAKALRVL